MPEPLSPERIAFLRSLTETEHYWLLPSQGKQLMGEIDRLTDALDAAQATAQGLRTALHAVAIRDCFGACSCAVCGATWEITLVTPPEPEHHAPGCLAAEPAETQP